MLYTDLDMQFSRKKLNREWIVAALILAMGIASLVTGLITRIKPLAIAGVIAFCMLAYFWYDMKVLPWRKYVRFLSDVAIGRAHEASGRVVKVESHVRKSEEGVDIRDFYLSENADEEDALFYWDNAKTLPDVVGRNVRVQAYGRYIIDISVN